MLTVGLVGILISHTAAQTAQSTGNEVPVVSIWRSGNSLITEGEDAVIVLTAEPAPEAELTVNLKVSQYRLAFTPNPDDPQFPSVEVIDLIEDVRQANIDTSGESRFVLPTEDDDQDEPLYFISVVMESGKGYSPKECGRWLCAERNVYVAGHLYTNPDSASFEVRDNDGPQAELIHIVQASEDLLKRVTRGPPTAAEVIEFEYLTRLAAEAAIDMLEGGTDTENALDLLRSSRMRLAAADVMVSAELTIAQEDVRQTIRNAANAIALYKSFPPDHFVISVGISSELRAETGDFLAASGSLIGSLAEVRQGIARIESVTRIIDEIEEFVFTAYRSHLDEVERRDITSISDAALEALFNPITSKLGYEATSTDAGATTSMLGNNPHLMRKAVELTGVDLTANDLIVSTAFRDIGGRVYVSRYFTPFIRHVSSSLRGAGLLDSEAELLTLDLSKFTNPDGIGFGDWDSEFESYYTVSKIIDEALGGEAETSYADNFLITTIRAEDMIFAVQVTSVKVVSGDFPEGWFGMDDGSFLLIRRGLAISIAPGSLDIVSFAGRIRELGYTLRVRENGAIVLTGDGMNISGTFSYTAPAITEDIGGDGEPNYGNCSFRRCIDPPTNANPASPDHYFTIGYSPFEYPLGFYSFGANDFTDLTDCESDPVACQIDREQRFLPIVAHEGLFDLLASVGLTATTDRFETGVITIAGLGKFRPAFEFEGELPNGTSEDLAAFSFAGTDANGDSVLDYRIRIGNFSQLLYGVP